MSLRHLDRHRRQLLGHLLEIAFSTAQALIDDLELGKSVQPWVPVLTQYAQLDPRSSAEMAGPLAQLWENLIAAVEEDSGSESESEGETEPEPPRSVEDRIADMYHFQMSQWAVDREPDNPRRRGKVEHRRLVVRRGNVYQTQATGGVVRGVEMPADSTPSGLAVSDADAVVAEAASREELGTSSADLPQITRYVQDTRRGHASLYVDGGPSDDDICQGGLGDCFFLSVVSTIAHHDPDQIRRIVRGDAERLSVPFRFWREVAAAKSTRGRTFRLPQWVKVMQELAHREDGELLAARVRVRPSGET